MRIEEDRGGSREGGEWKEEMNEMNGVKEGGGVN